VAVSAEAPRPDLDPHRFAIERFDGRGFSQAFVREGVGGVPLLLVHGWPETKRIWWRVVEPLVTAGFEVIAPDLRGFGDSDVGPDGYHDVPAHSRDLAALIEHLGHDRVILAGGDLGGPVVQDLARRVPGLARHVVLFNCPLPRRPDGDGGPRRTNDRSDALARSAAAIDYFVRQGTDADALAAELDTPERRRRYIATFYTSRFWAHPGAFDADAVAFHAEPFGDGVRLRAGFGAYESVFDPAARSERSLLAVNPDVRVVILYGPSDHVIPADFDRHAAEVFPDHVGPFLLRDCGHFVPWEAPGVLVSAIGAFCSDLLG